MIMNNDNDSIEKLYENIIKSVEDFDNTNKYNKLINAERLKAAVVKILSLPHKVGLLEQVMELHEIRDPHDAIANMLDDVIDLWADEDSGEYPEDDNDDNDDSGNIITSNDL